MNRDATIAPSRSTAVCCAENSGDGDRVSGEAGWHTLTSVRSQR